MKAILDKFLWKIGFYGPIPLAPSRAYVDEPYAYCYDMARYQACSINLGHLENSVFALGKPEHKKPHKGGFVRVFE